MNKPVYISAQIEGIQSRKDKTCKISLGTNELTPQNAALVFGLNQKFAFVALKPDEFKTDEKEIIENLQSGYEDSSKTPSQRLRGVLFVLWKQNEQGYDDFNDFYRHKVEAVIEHFKSKIDEE